MDLDLDFSSTTVEKDPKKVLKQEVINYLVNEIGEDLEFSWNTDLLFMEGNIKVSNLGTVIKQLAAAKFI